MAINFPTALDVFVNPQGSASGKPTNYDQLNTIAVIHGYQHANANDAIAALQAKVGIDGSTVVTSLDYLIKNTTGGHRHDGTSSRQVSHGSLANIDTDSSATAIHHTLGSGVNQAAVGNHTHAYVPTTRTINTTAPLTGGGDLSADRTLGISNFVGSGASHASGAVPDPGAVAGTTKFLREDGTWAVSLGANVDTRANILAATPTAGKVMFTSDTLELAIGNGTNWYLVPFAAVRKPNVPDIGYTQGSSRIGYGTDYVSDKLIANSRIGSNAKTTLADGDIRVSSGTLQIYLSGAWKNVVTGFVLREDSAEGFEFEHQPVGFTSWIEIMSGNSDVLGLNGLPLTQGYATSMGAYPAPLQVDGGTF